jgi:hypothetical protein
MDDIERLPLDAGVAPRTTVGTAQAGDADAAMNAGGVMAPNESVLGSPPDAAAAASSWAIGVRTTGVGTGGAAAAVDEAMDDIERLPLDAGVAPRTTVGTARVGVSTGRGCRCFELGDRSPHDGGRELGRVDHDRRKISIPPHRMTPLKRDWIKIYTPLVEECGLQVRMNG